MSSPLASVAVAVSVPTTHGRPSSRDTIPAWQIIPPDVRNDGRRVSHRDHHVGICHWRYEHRSGPELKRLFNVEHEMDGTRSGAGARRYSRQNRGIAAGRWRTGIRVTGECSSDRPGLDDVQRVVMDDPFDVLRCSESLLQALSDLSQRTGMLSSQWSFERIGNVVVQPQAARASLHPSPAFRNLPRRAQRGSTAFHQVRQSA